MALSFIFDAEKGETPASVAKKRAIVQALMSSQRAPQNIGEGLNALGDGIVQNVLNRRADAAETAGQAHATDAFGGMINAGTFPAAPGSPVAASASGAADYGGDQLAWQDAKPYQKALLNTISGPESGGRYNVIYGGGKFDDFSHHPNQAVRIQTGPNAGRTSSAAGKYQFLGSTWDDEAKELGLPDFSPVNQDKAAWNLAAKTYKAKTGQVLDDVLQSGDPDAIANVGKVLGGTWTSLPGGIEQGTNTNRFVATYQKALGAGATPAQAAQVAQQEQSQDPVQVASLDPSAGMKPAPAPLTAMAPGTTAPAYDPSGLPPLDPNDPMAPATRPTYPGAPQESGTAGEVRRGADGKTYQFVETTGMAGATGDQGWIPVNADAPLPNPGPGDPAATTPAGQRVLSTMMSPEPLSGRGGVVQALSAAQQPAPAAAAPSPVVAALAGAQQPQQASPASPGIQKVAQAMSPQEDLASIPVEAGGTGGAIQPGQGGPSIQQIMQVAADPWASPEQKAMANMMLQQKMQEADPLRQLQIQAARKSLAVPPKQWQKLDDDTLFDPASGETKSISGGGPTKFEGNGLDAQAWNILSTADPASREYATAYAIISQPKTQMVQTPDGMVPIQVPPNLPAWLQAPGGGVVPAAPAAPGVTSPAQVAPPAAGAPAPAVAAPPSAAPSAGAVIPGTMKPTETQRNRVSSVNQAFDAITGELDRYSELVAKTGIEAMPGASKDNLNTVRQGIMLQMKELFNLGVLNGPDLQLMENMIYDPVVDVIKDGGAWNLPSQVYTAATGGAGDRAANSVKELKRMLEGIKASVDRTTAEPNAPAPSPNPDGWKDVGNGVRIRVKP